MILAAALLAAPVMVQVPLAPAPLTPNNPLSVPADPAKLTLVIADTVKQENPVPLCPGDTCTRLFRGTFAGGKVLAGQPLPAKFVAQLVMGSPYNTPYRLAFVIEHREGKVPLVRATRGFHTKTRQACFADGQLDGIDWQPQEPGITYDRKVLCVSE